MLDSRYTLFNCWVAAAKAEHMGQQNRVLAVIATLVVVALPIFELMALASLLLVPMQNVDHRRWHRLCSWVENFSCLDVFLLALFAMKVEVPRLSHAINQHFTCTVEILPSAIVCAVGSCIIDISRSMLLCMHLAVLKQEERLAAVCDDNGYAVMQLLPADGSDVQLGDDLQHCGNEEWVGRASSPTIHILGIRHIDGECDHDSLRDGNTAIRNSSKGNAHSKDVPIVVGHL